MQQVIGPFNLGINQEVGLLVEGFNTPPRVMTTHSPRYYNAAIQNCGYQPAQDLLAYELDIHTYNRPALMDELTTRNADRIRVRPLDKKNKLADLDAMLSEAGFRPTTWMQTGPYHWAFCADLIATEQQETD